MFGFSVKGTRQILSSFVSTRVSSFVSMAEKRILCLFDVDGTLTVPRGVINPEFHNFLTNTVRTKADIALVGGSDYGKICEQMGGEAGLKKFHSVFSENGLVAHKNGTEISRQSIQAAMGDDVLQRFINFALGYMSQLTLPLKRGNFIEFRSGLINVCPVGRSCTQAERDQFSAYDAQHKIREKFVAALEKEFPDLGLVYAIGGQISIDVYPIGWDKTFCLRHLPENEFSEIHFFGDRTEPGGNDHALFKHSRVIGHTVASPDDTKKQLSQLLNLS